MGLFFLIGTFLILQIKSCVLKNSDFNLIYGIDNQYLSLELSEYYQGISNYFVLQGPGNIEQIVSPYFKNLNYQIIDQTLINVQNDPNVQQSDKIAVLGQTDTSYFIIQSEQIENSTTTNSINYLIPQSSICTSITSIFTNSTYYLIVSCLYTNSTGDYQQLQFINSGDFDSQPQLYEYEIDNVTLDYDTTQQIQISQVNGIIYLIILTNTKFENQIVVNNIMPSGQISQIQTYTTNHIISFYYSTEGVLFTLSDIDGLTLIHQDNSTQKYNPSPNDYGAMNIYEIQINPTFISYYVAIANSEGVLVSIQEKRLIYPKHFYKWFDDLYDLNYMNVIVTPKYLIGFNGMQLQIFPGIRNPINEYQPLFILQLHAKLLMSYNYITSQLYIGLVGQAIGGSMKVVNPRYYYSSPVDQVDRKLKITAQDYKLDKCTITFTLNTLPQFSTELLPTRALQVPIPIIDFKQNYVDLSSFFCGPGITIKNYSFTEPSLYGDQVIMNQIKQMELSLNATFAQIFYQTDRQLILVEFILENTTILLKQCEYKFQSCISLFQIINTTYTDVSGFALSYLDHEIILCVIAGDNSDIYFISYKQQQYQYQTTLQTVSDQQVYIHGGYLFLLTPDISYIYQLDQLTEPIDEDEGVSAIYYDYTNYENTFFVVANGLTILQQMFQGSLITLDSINQLIIGLTSYGYYYIDSSSQLILHPIIEQKVPIIQPIYNYVLNTDYVCSTPNHLYIGATKDLVNYILIYSYTNSAYNSLYQVIQLTDNIVQMDCTGVEEYDILLLNVNGIYTTYQIFNQIEFYFTPITNNAQDQSAVSNTLNISVSSINQEIEYYQIEIKLLDFSSHVNQEQIKQLTLIDSQTDLLYQFDPREYLIGNIYNYTIFPITENTYIDLKDPIQYYPQNDSGVQNPMSVVYYQNMPQFVNDTNIYGYQIVGNQSYYYSLDYQFSITVSSSTLIGMFIEFYTQMPVLMYYLGGGLVSFNMYNSTSKQSITQFAITANLYGIVNFYYMNGILQFITKQSNTQCQIEIGVFMASMTDDIYSSFMEYEIVQQDNIPCDDMYTPLNISMASNIAEKQTQIFGIAGLNSSTNNVDLYTFKLFLNDSIMAFYQNQTPITSKPTCLLDVEIFVLNPKEIIGKYMYQENYFYQISQIDYPKIISDSYSKVPILLTSLGYNYQLDLHFVYNHLETSFNCYFQGYEYQQPLYLLASNGIVTIIYRLPDNNNDIIVNYGQYEQFCQDISTVYSLGGFKLNTTMSQYTGVYGDPFYYLVGIDINNITYVIEISDIIYSGIIPLNTNTTSFYLGVQSKYNSQLIKITAQNNIEQGEVFTRQIQYWEYGMGAIFIIIIFSVLGYLCYQSR